MRIAVNVQTLVKDKLEGLGWFTFETMQRVVKMHPEHEFVFIFGKGINNSFIFADNVIAKNIGPPFFRPLAWLLKFEVLLPIYVNRNNFDLYLSTDGWSSSFIKTKKILIVHDLNFEHFPHFLPFSFRHYYRLFFKQWVKRANGLATVSEYSKNDIVKTYQYPAGKIEVLYNGASSAYKPITNVEKDNTQRKYTNGSPYFVFVGALHPRKNVGNLFLAFDKFKVNDTRNTKLLIVGAKFYWDKKTDAIFNGLAFKDDVILVGRLTQEELKFALGASIALVYVSLFEGFGIPIVEAMNCNVPIITANNSSMPEIAGKAALIVDANNINEISSAMCRMATDEGLRKRLVDAGIIQRKKFSWDTTAQKLSSVISKCLSE